MEKYGGRSMLLAVNSTRRKFHTRTFILLVLPGSCFKGVLLLVQRVRLPLRNIELLCIAENCRVG